MAGDGKTVVKWAFGTLGILVVMSVIMFALSSAGLVGKKFVERKVFENSYQYTEARKSELLTYEAQLAEIDAKLMSPNLSEEVRADLESVRAGINVLMTAAEGR